MMLVTFLEKLKSNVCKYNGKIKCVPFSGRIRLEMLLLKVKAALLLGSMTFFSV